MERTREVKKKDAEKSNESSTIEKSIMSMNVDRSERADQVEVAIAAPVATLAHIAFFRPMPVGSFHSQVKKKQ